MSLGYYKFTVSSDNSGQTLKTFLRREVGISARSMTVLKYAGMGITRSGIELKAHDIVYEGDIIEIQLPPDSNDAEPVEGRLDVLFEDDCLLIVNKPYGMPVHPVKVHQLDTLSNIVAYYQQSRGESYTFRALNRLDKDTSGCVIIAKDRIAYSLVQPTVEKRYIAVCEGTVSESGVIDAPIALEPDSKIKRCIRSDGDPAVTHYDPVYHANAHTLCELWLETGRTHQIRCHMSSIGHPLAGDDMYGGSLDYIQRQALHCRDVSFIHPVTKEKIIINTEIPEEFFAIMNTPN